MVEVDVVEVMPVRVMRGPAMCRYLGDISLAHFYRLIKAGEIPPGISIGPGVKVWPVEAADRFIERRKAAAYGCRGAA